ncbi:MAG: PEP-CTERM sorting domain-containing protein [Phycisphaerae bacterium]
MKNVRLTICLTAAVLFMAAGQGFGIAFNDGGTYNINYTINDGVYVDEADEASGMQTTLNLLEGGSINSVLVAFHNSQVTITGGTVGSVVQTYDSSQVKMFGGTVNALYACGNSQITMSGGTVGDALYATNNGQLTITDGTLGFGLSASGDSRVTMSGGTIARGSLYFGMQLQEQMILAISGFDFAIDGIHVGFGEITSQLGGIWYNDPVRRLTGTLANGDKFDNQFLIGNTAKIVLVPEPATLLLLGLGGLVLRRKNH